MSKWDVTFEVRGSWYVTVEAETQDEATDLAWVAFQKAKPEHEWDVVDVSDEEYEEDNNTDGG